MHGDNMNCKKSRGEFFHAGVQMRAREDNGRRRRIWRCWRKTEFALTLPSPIGMGEGFRSLSVKM